VSVSLLRPSERFVNLQDKAQKYLPGAALGMLYLPDNFRPVIARGEGSRVWDTAGKSYIDYMLGSGPLLVGHAHPDVVEAVREQAARSATYYLLSEPAILLAEKIVQAVPCGEAIKFQLGGSDATFNALRIARAATGRRLIIKFEGGFHGWHDVAQHSIARRPGTRPHAVPESAGIAQSIKDDIRVARFNDLESVSALLEANAKDVAAIIVEPMQRALLPAAGFLQGLRELATKYGCLLIFDEVVTGFRLAWGGGQERFGVVPDLACYGKAIGGGYPISAIVGPKDLLSLTDPRKKGGKDYCYVSGTFAGNPLSSAAGLATLNVLDRPGTYDRLRVLGQRLRQGLEEAGRAKRIPIKALGDGPVVQALFTKRTRFETLDDFADVEADLHRRFAYEMIARGVLILPAGKIYISLAHSDADIDATVAHARDALHTLAH
jgi:glutamate-1-semialdehyde 2,1-aminomutase